MIADGDDISVVAPAWSVLLKDWSCEPVARVILRERVDRLDADAEREDVMGYEIDEAFAYADMHLDRRISAALHAAGDPLSMSLANTVSKISARLPA